MPATRAFRPSSFASLLSERLPSEIHAGVVEALALSIGPVWAQVFAFPFAASAAWWLNRQFTFGPSARTWRREWLRYIAANPHRLDCQQQHLFRTCPELAARLRTSISGGRCGVGGRHVLQFRGFEVAGLQDLTFPCCPRALRRTSGTGMRRILLVPTEGIGSRLIVSPLRSIQRLAISSPPPDR